MSMLDPLRPVLWRAVPPNGRDGSRSLFRAYNFDPASLEWWEPNASSATVLIVDSATAEGIVVESGIATGVGVATATGTGQTLETGIATGAGASTSTATGRDVQAGAATGAGASTSTGTGIVVESGTATGAGAGSTTATGVDAGSGGGGGAIPQIGEATGAGVATGEATGITLETGISAGAGSSTGEATGTVVESGIATGTGASSAGAEGVTTVPGDATGAGVATGEATGTVVESGIAIGTGSSVTMAEGLDLRSLIGRLCGGLPCLWLNDPREYYETAIVLLHWTSGTAIGSNDERKFRAETLDAWGDPWGVPHVDVYESRHGRQRSTLTVRVDSIDQSHSAHRILELLRDRLARRSVDRYLRKLGYALEQVHPLRDLSTAWDDRLRSCAALSIALHEITSQEDANPYASISRVSTTRNGAPGDRYVVTKEELETGLASLVSSVSGRNVLWWDSPREYVGPEESIVLLRWITTDSIGVPEMAYRDQALEYETRKTLGLKIRVLNLHQNDRSKAVIDRIRVGMGWLSSYAALRRLDTGIAGWSDMTEADEPIDQRWRSIAEITCSVLWHETDRDTSDPVTSLETINVARRS